MFQSAAECKLQEYNEDLKDCSAYIQFKVGRCLLISGAVAITHFLQQYEVSLLTIEKEHIIR